MSEPFTLRHHSQRRSCLLCRSRKVKCDRQQPCGGCIRAASTCIYPSGTGRAPKQPQQSTNNPAVLDRLDRLESIIRQLESQQTQHQPLDLSTVSLPPQGNQRNGRLAIDSTSSVYVSNVLWASLGDEIEELRDLLHGPPSTNDDDDEGVWQEETDEQEQPVGTIGLNAAIMGFRSLAHSLRDYHPSISQSVALFEIFQTNVAPVVKIFHMPTLTKLFWDAVASLDTLDCNTEALLLAIYYAAIISTTDQTQCPLVLPRPQALRTFRFAIEQALARADLLNTQNMILLQAAALFLCALRNEDDSRTVWSLTALIVHIAQAMGLHRDGTAFGLRPLETELRRRLWWFIVGLDQRSSEYHGYEPIVSESSFDTRLPLNINDSDLTADLVQPPTERDGATEMTLSLIGFESIPIVRKVSFIPPHRRQARTTSTASVTELSLPEREALAEQLQSRLETRYLAYCDPAEPFLFVSATVARLIIARVWLMVHYPRKRVDSCKEVSAAPLQASLQDKIFHLAIEISELSCSVLCNPNIAHWAWRSDTYSQWHAVALDCDRAWAAVEILYDRWRMKEHARKGTLWKPIGRLMAKARYVREMQSVDKGCSLAGSSSVVEVSPELPQVAHQNNVTTTLDPLDDIFSLPPFMDMSPSLDDLFLVDDDFVQVSMRTGF
ncbi:putative C6 transcription factor [Aspergillus novofumigatus IBT 16806]|uniref:Putative fungal-specific transcription factor n=1 Tax=Aspergillus novofumigatus (strain IBT 16806) TaxID=1392255 RepID=A0A2I1C0Y9_ASPN1|nr:putative fungal-specific transcription factor [Aspergillus novofumigatus IBT 16806]PKX91289.1 putative fungal-specific transcription factor [Aspergillus novofumigatus IBT 16806]